MTHRSREQRSAVVTGAGSGLGRAFVLELAARGGARVLACDIDPASLEETAQMARARGAEVVTATCDVASEAAVAALADRADQTLGTVDLVINNAGVAVGGQVGETPLDDWRWIVSINLMGVVHGCHFFAPRLRTQGHGAILNVASAAGLIATPGMAAYNATKFGVVGLSEALHAELSDVGVGVTVLCPTFFPTNIVESARGPADASLKKVARGLMAASKLDAADVARAALRASANGELYCVPMNDARAMWALKRLSPEQWSARIGPAVYRLARGRFSRR